MRTCGVFKEWIGNHIPMQIKIKNGKHTEYQANVKTPFKNHFKQFHMTIMTQHSEVPSKNIRKTNGLAIIICRFDEKMMVAESKGFEPLEPCGSTVFKTAAFDHSASSPLEMISQTKTLNQPTPLESLLF